MKDALVVPLVNVPACNATQQEQCPSLLTKGSDDCCDWTAAAAVTHCVVVSAQRALNAGFTCKLTLQHKTMKVPDHTYYQCENNNTVYLLLHVHAPA